MQLTRREFILALTGSVGSSLLVMCHRDAPHSQDTAKPAAQLKIYGWEGYMPHSVLDAFAAEYHVAVDYVAYGDSEEAIEAMRRGEMYDVVVLGDLDIPAVA